MSPDVKNLIKQPARAQLVVDLTLYLPACRALLGGAPGQGRPDRATLHRASLELGGRTRVEKLIGVANCLTACAGFLDPGGPLNAGGLSRALERLSELVEQVRAELAKGNRSFVDEQLARARGEPAAKAEPVEQPAPEPLAQPTPLPPAPSFRVAAPAVRVDVALPRMVTVFSPAKTGVNAAEPERPAMRPVSETAPAPEVQPMAVRVVDVGSTETQGAPPANASPPRTGEIAAPKKAAPEPQGGDPVMGRPPPQAAKRPTMFGLRAFGRRDEPPPRATDAPRPTGSPLLGLQPGFARPSRSTSEDPLIAATPLPPTPMPNEPAAGRTWMRQMFERGRRARRPHPEGSHARRSGSELPEERIRSRARSPDWVLIGVAAAALGAAGMASVAIWNRLRGSSEQQESAAQAPLASASAPSPVVSGVPPTTTATAPSTDEVDSEAELSALREKAHASGAESPELRAWIDEQAALQAKLLETGRCEGSAAACAPLLKAREELRRSRRTANVGSVRRSISSGDMRPRWLLGLSLPEQFPIDDHERVEFLFEKYSDTPTGRAAFESLLFRCGKYRELVQATLIRYELPPSLFAVVYAESGCSPVAKSPVGAEGLWQFMPEAAKAYHLRIIEDVVDERLSPRKSTEAAIHFLADLYRKFKSWDLVFAAYNMGPYGLAARMHVAGGDDVTFWDLLDADLVPSETANYVPTIEAFALISENLARLKFAGSQVAPPEVTARLDVPPGTRLSLIARAASTSVTQLRQLNPDLKADAVPSLRGELFPIEVIRDVAPQARDALKELVESRAVGHLCVPVSYDWGKEPYTAEMEEACKRKLGGGASAPTPQ